MSNVNTLGSFGDTSNSSLMFRNKLINGGFNIWQRGTSFSSLSTYTYTADRWLTDGALTSVARTGANNNVLNFVTPSATQAGIAQRIETAANSFAAGQVYTISFQANCTVANLQVVATYRAGNTFKSTQLSVDVSSQLTAGSYSSVRTILTLTNAPADFASTDCLQISILTSAANTVNLQNVQIETGTSATPFEQRPIGMELSLCQRYCIQYGGDNLFNQFVLGFATSTTAATSTLYLPQKMRSTPTLTTAGGIQVSDGVTATGVTGISVFASGSSTQIICISLAVSSGLTAFRPIRVEAANTLATSFVFSAEL